MFHCLKYLRLILATNLLTHIEPKVQVQKDNAIFLNQQKLIKSSFPNITNKITNFSNLTYEKIIKTMAIVNSLLYSPFYCLFDPATRFAVNIGIALF